MVYLLAIHGCNSHDEKRSLHGEKQDDLKVALAQMGGV